MVWYGRVVFDPRTQIILGVRQDYNNDSYNDNWVYNVGDR